MKKRKIICLLAGAMCTFGMHAQAIFPKLTTEGDTTWYAISTPHRMALHMTSEGASANIKGREATFKDNQLWCFISTENGRFNLKNKSHNSYLNDSQGGSNSYYHTISSVPQQGFKLTLVESYGLYNMTDANGNMVNQCEGSHNYQFTKWNYSTDPGNLFEIMQVDPANTALAFAVKEANALLRSTVEGIIPGTFSKETRDALSKVLAEATTADEVNEAMNTYKQSINTVQAGKYYYFKSTGPSYCNGKVMYNTSPSSGAYLRWGDKTTDENIYWEFVPVENNPSQYLVRNKATGNYLHATSAGSKAGEVRGVKEINEATTYFELTPLYQDNSFLICPIGGNPVHAQEDFGVIVTWNSTNYGSASSWKIIEATAEEIQLAEAKTKSDEQEYVIKWNEEFEREGAVDENDWNFGYGLERNQEAQWYQKENAWQEGGNLVIEARKERKDNPWYEAGSSNWKTSRQYIDYTSANLTTANKHDMLYGRLEVRAKIPCVSGSWPAIWLLGYENVAGEWPSSGEIDVLEYYKDATLANLVWASDTRWNGIWEARKTPVSGYWQKQDPEWANKYHVWRMDWDEESIKLYLDDELITICHLSRTINRGQWKKVDNPFHTPQYLLLNLALGGNNGGTIIDSTLPLRYLIDYVRIYQKKPGSSIETIEGSAATKVVSFQGNSCQINLSSFKGNVEATIYSISGRRMHTLSTQASRASVALEVKSLPKGVYVVHISDGVKRISEKLIMK